MITISLGLDLGTTTGVAVADNCNPGFVLTTAWNLKGNPYFLFYQKLTDLSLKRNIKEIAYEDVTFIQKGLCAVRIYFGLLGVLKLFASYNKIPLYGYNVKTIKKFVTNNGNASKEDVCVALMKHGVLHHPGETLDESDAASVIYYHRNKEERCYEKKQQRQ